MKKVLIIVGIAASILACQDESAKKSAYTGNESIYPLLAGSDYAVDGKVTFREKVDGTTDIQLTLKGAEGDALYPVHLHLGDIAKDGADVAALLNPVSGKTGSSTTTLKTLANESVITYQQLIKLNACIKVHLSDSGPNQDVVLAGGNIGAAAADNLSSGRIGLSVCRSN